MSYITFQPHDYFNTKLYTGNAGTNAQTGVGFQPDWLWVKARNRNDNHRVIDVLRGTNAFKMNESNAQTDVSGDGFTSLDSDGFTLNGSGGGGEFNANSGTFAAWNWKAGGAGSANNDGATASTVSASPTSGFAVVTHTGTGGATTIGHGLNATPRVIFTKMTSGSNNTFVQQPILGGSWTSNNYISITTDSGAASASSSTIINAVTNSTISFAGSDDWVNGNGSSYVHYVFAEKNGFSKFGQYIGNGNGNGPTIYAGFKPAWFLVKKTNVSGEYWGMYDNKRNTFNDVDDALMANRTDQEADMGDGVDFLATGIKVRDTGGELNASGATYFYMMFAEEPTVSSNGDPATAR
jgi:hypothetical protein